MKDESLEIRNIHIYNRSSKCCLLPRLLVAKLRCTTLDTDLDFGEWNNGILEENSYRGISATQSDDVNFPGGVFA